jgi:hypothetical protein
MPATTAPIRDALDQPVEILASPAAICYQPGMTSGHRLSRMRFVLPAVGGVALLLLLWVTPSGRGRESTVGTWLLAAEDWNALCGGWLILTVTAAMCWWQCRTRVRLSEVHSGHWLWLAAGLVFLMIYVRGMRVGEVWFALGMLPPLLLCGLCWACGAKTGMGFVWPLLMLYAFVPECGSYVRRWSYHLDLALCEWLQQDMWERTRPALEWGIYPYFPKPAESLFLALALCWLPRWCWWKMALIVLAGISLAATHVYLFGQDTC